MGSGIARLFSQNRFNVALYDPNPQALINAKQKIDSNESIKKSELPKECMQYSGDLEKVVQGADLVIECAPEVLKVKRSLYSDLSPFLKAEAIIASNTSTFSLESLAQDQPFADRMLIMHFFNPPQVIPLVEIVKIEQTRPGLAGHIADLLQYCGRQPVILKRDITGFIANRLQAAIVREACFLLANGVADAGQIDSVVKNGLGIRWTLNGPFEIADFGGLDVWEKVLNQLLPVLSNERNVPQILKQKVELNNLGLKTGKGFFDYPGSADAINEARNEKLIRLLQVLELS